MMAVSSSVGTVEGVKEAVVDDVKERLLLTPGTS